MKNKLDIFEAIKPVVIFSNVFGMPSISYLKDGNRKCYKNVQQTILTTTQLLVITTCFIIGFGQRETFVKNYDSVGKYVEFLQISTDIIVTICNYILSTVHRDNYFNILLNLQQLDHIFITTQHFYKQLRKYGLLIIFVWILICVLQMSIDMIYLFKGSLFFYWITYWVPYFITAITECNVMINLNGLKHRYMYLNQILKKDISKCSSFTSQNEKIILAIKNARYLHWHLTDLGNKINKIFSVQMLFMSANSFISILSSCYNMWVKYNNTDKILSIVTFVGETYNSLSNCLRVIVVIYSYTSVTGVVSCI